MTPSYLRVFEFSEAPFSYPPDEPRMVEEAGGRAGWGHEQSKKPALDRGTSKAGPLGSGTRRTEHDRAGA